MPLDYSKLDKRLRESVVASMKDFLNDDYYLRVLLREKEKGMTLPKEVAQRYMDRIVRDLKNAHENSSRGMLASAIDELVETINKLVFYLIERDNLEDTRSDWLKSL